MLTKIEALNYRCLRYVSQPLERFHVLVGPNASGKTTALDVAAFMSDLLNDGLEAAIRSRTPDPCDLLFCHKGSRFELAVEAEIPKHLRSIVEDQTRIRYEVRIELEEESGEPSIASEILRFKPEGDVPSPQRQLFPAPLVSPETLVMSRSRGTKHILSKSPETGKDNFYPEVKKGKGSGWVPSFQLGGRRSTFANLPEDETRFPVATWFKEFLSAGVESIVLDSLAMRLASPPALGREFKTDGTNLPWVISGLEESHPDVLDDWIAHLQTALPDIEGIRTVEREDDRHRYLKIRYAGGLEVPSWMASDGTLRLLALTLLAYLPDLDGAYLIEEPENGIHPRAVETMFQSLSNVYGAQILMATHSPVILNCVDPGDVLCFAKDEVGAADIVRGDCHPSLADWQRSTSLGVLFAAGVLG